MKKIKEKVIRKLIDIGKRNKKLIAPILAVMTMFLIAYYSTRDFCIRMTKPQFRKRFICINMIIVMFFTQTGIADVLAAGIIGIAESGNLREAESDGDIHQIVDFEPLAEEIREQKVLPGTTIDGISVNISTGMSFLYKN